jgi:ATP phosphoribosyltransferase regulatory subunit
MTTKDPAATPAVASPDGAAARLGRAASAHAEYIDRARAAASQEPGADRLLELFAARGFARVEPPVLQPLEPFIDLSGEDLRRRMFVTTDASGRELCLRPEYTIPVSRLHLERSDRAPSAAYAYFGPVFRFRPDATGEFWQAGVEDFGRQDREAADAEILDIAIEALREEGADTVATMIGDVGLFNALVEASGLSGSTARRLRRGFAAGKLDASALEALGQPGAESAHGGLLAALQGQDPAAARLFVEDIFKIAGITTISGRTAGEIAARFLDQASSQRSGMSREQAELFQRYLGIAGHPDEGAAALRLLASDADIDLRAAIETLEIRNGFIEARGVDLSALRFSTAFGRNLDYYTGFVFEIKDGRDSRGRTLVGGGRYDGLLRRLGSPADIPAVGCSIWIDRLRACRS